MTHDHSNSVFTNITRAPEDSILGVTVAYNKDLDPSKMNLGVGAYRTEDHAVLRTPKHSLTHLNREAQNQHVTAFILSESGMDKSRRKHSYSLEKRGSVGGLQDLVPDSKENTPEDVVHKGDDLTNFRDGVISSAFMVGLLIASPIFASLVKRLCKLVFPAMSLV
ncbi:hypothetical protein L6452_35954 [Arctium lappa]|uniref:Uncharacterized protein n=1 Tax=Arctium lappa TaxID=4217 RepID=A0ACB8Y785_ARCLA|nr:hypothetical protein L6452_35954 [Arctium lappa]